MHRVLFIALALVLAACGGSTAAPAAPAVNVQATVDAAVKATLAAQPTATPAPTNTPSPPTATSVPPTATAIPATATARPTNTPPPPPTATPGPCQINDVCSVGGVVVRVAEKTERVPRINQFLNPPAGADYIVMTVVVGNERNQPIPYNPLYFRLKDSQGREYNNAALAPEPTLKFGNLGPGEIASGNIAFEVRQDAKDFVLTYNPLVIGGNFQPVRIQLDR